MIKNKFINISILTLLVISVLSPFHLVKADSNSVGNYAVNMIINKDSASKYWDDLFLKPGEVRKISVNLINRTSKPIKITTTINNSYTSDSGTTSYDRSDPPLLNSDQPNLRSLVVGKIDREYKLSGNESKIVSYNIKAPQQKFSGMLVGAFYCSANVSNGNQGKVSVQQAVAYSLGIVLRMQKDKIDPQLLVKNITPSALKGERGFQINIENPTNTVLSDLSIKTKVIKNGKNKTDQLPKSGSLKMAPHSSFNYFVPYKNLDPGTYGLTIDTSAKNGDQVIKNKTQFHKVFKKTVAVNRVISIEDPASLTDPLQSLSFWFWLFGIMFVVLVIALVIYFYFYGRRKGIIGNNKKNKK